MKKTLASKKKNKTQIIYDNVLFNFFNIRYITHSLFSLIFMC
jgi:hypothetical protein